MRNIGLADKWRLSALAILALLAGCDNIVKVETYPERATLEPDAQVSCSHDGYCYGLRYDGKFGFGHGAFCPGQQAAAVKHIPARRTYESGRVENYTIDTITQVKGACQ
jgi:hypothetical protein